MARRPPSRQNSRSCSTRRNFAWATGVISLTSSRNSTPPAANSICPGFARCATVNAPRSNPNNSDSSSDSGSAAQLIATNGPRRRGEARWMNRATTSFPTPDSPCRHVVVSVAATWIALLSTSHQAGDWPTGLPVRRTSSRSFWRRHSRACQSEGPDAAAWSLVLRMLITVLITIPQSCVRTYRRLLLLLKYLPVGLAIRTKAAAFPPFPVGLEFGCRDIPVRTAFSQHDPQVLPKLLDSGSAKEPVAVVDLEHHETRFEDDDMRNHGVVLRVRVLGDVEILLNLASRIGQEGPMRAD